MISVIFLLVYRNRVYTAYIQRAFQRTRLPDCFSDERQSRKRGILVQVELLPNTYYLVKSAPVFPVVRRHGRCTGVPRHIPRCQLKRLNLLVTWPLIPDTEPGKWRRTWRHVSCDTSLPCSYVRPLWWPDPPQYLG